MPMTLAVAASATVILVHGAFADGSSWNRVIAGLQRDHVRVIAVQNPLTSLADDVAATRRAIETASGPVILVGHSWGGAVISQAGDDPNVRALVFVAAFAPDAGMSVNDLGRGARPPDWLKSAHVDSAGFITLPQVTVETSFAQDLPKAEADILASTQGPTAASAFDEKLGVAAWHFKPVWYVVASKDRMIPPAAEQAMARAMHAHVIELPTSHVAMLAEPEQVVSVIEDAISASEPRTQ